MIFQWDNGCILITPDSTCILLKALAAKWAPSTSKVRPGQVKIHTIISLPVGVPLCGEITGQKVHDNPKFREDMLEAGTLTLFDLGFTDTDRFLGAREKGAYFLTRLKDNFNPVVCRVYQGGFSKKAARGKRLKEALSDRTLGDDGWVIDIEAEFEGKTKHGMLRVVGIFDGDSEWHFYVTNVPRTLLNAREVEETYRLRWEIELIYKQLKSGAGLQAILAWRSCAVAALIYAKIIALCLTRLLELTIKKEAGDTAVGQLALMLTLSRAMPLLLSYFMMKRGVTLEQLEERILLIARIVAKSRNQRREREKRKRIQRLAANAKPNA